MAIRPIDMTAHLHAGLNVIGAEVLFFGWEGGTWVARKPGFSFSLEVQHGDGRYFGLHMIRVTLQVEG